MCQRLKWRYQAFKKKSLVTYVILAIITLNTPRNQIHNVYKTWHQLKYFSLKINRLSDFKKRNQRQTPTIEYDEYKLNLLIHNFINHFLLTINTSDYLCIYCQLHQTCINVLPRYVACRRFMKIVEKTKLHVISSIKMI